MDGFVHLHLHSEYSLLDGACRVADIPKAAKKAGHSAVAITDHGVMYGAVKFYEACKKEGVKPIIGCEVYLAEGSRHEKNKMSGGYTHLVLLVKNETGYRNLIYMVSKGFTDGFYSKPRIDMDLLREHSEGLVALSGCIAGEIPKLLLAGEYELAKKKAQQMIRLFEEDSFYLEIQNHGIPEEAEVIEGICRISRETGIPLVATNDVHYLEKRDAEYQAVLLCIQTNNKITDGRPIGFDGDEYYYKSTDEMKALFSQYKGAIENTVRIAEMCSFDFDFSKTFLPRYTCPDGKSPDEYLKELTRLGLEKRIDSGAVVLNVDFSFADYEERYLHELSVIAQMGYSEYFLIVWDFVNYAKGKGITVGPGRGSGAGSLVAFLIGITDIDSLKYELIFESFLNVDRVSMPDFDIDFADNRREEVIEYVKMKYGDDHVSQIITFGTMSARAVVRDVGRALGMNYGTFDAVAKAIPRDLTLKEALEIPEIKELYGSDSEIKNLLDTSMALEGMPRHASTHAAGVVITDRPVSDYVPLAVTGGNSLTQFDMDTIANLGLLKFDFLGIRYLTVIAECEKQIRKKQPEFDINSVTYDDAKTYRLICKGNTEGVFQLNSAGMRAKLMQMKPESFDDIIAAIALYRPGPMKAGAVDAYAANKHDKSKIKYVTEKLAPVLDSTYGCLVYQEQVAQIFRELAGFSFSRADNVRRAIKKKKASIIEGEKEHFISGAAQNGISREAAEKIFSDIEGFSEYAFNKSHATAYAVTAYRTAYLKAHFKKEYYSALMTAEMSYQGKIFDYVTECRRGGLSVLLPDVNCSFEGFSPDEDGIRFGLLAIQNVGRPLAEFIVRDRERDSKYRSFDEFLDRMEQSDLNKRQYEMLVKSGALDCFEHTRSSLLAIADKVIESKNAAKSLSDSGQMDIMSMLDEEDRVDTFTVPYLEELPLTIRLKYERESLGISLSGSLLDKYSEHIGTLKTVDVRDINEAFSTDKEGTEAAFDETSETLRDGQKINVVGVVNKRVNKNTKNGDAMAFVSIEDQSGEIEIVVFPKLLSSISYLLFKDSAIGVSGTVSVKEDSVSILANKIFSLKENGEQVTSGNTEVVSAPTVIKTEDTKENTSHFLYIKIDDVDTPTYTKVHSVVEKYKGAYQVVFYSMNRKKYIKEKGLTAGFRKSLLDELEGLLGEGCAVFK